MLALVLRMPSSLGGRARCRLGRVCHLLGNTTGRRLRRHLLAGELRQRRPVDSIRQHKLLAADLSSPLQEVALLHNGIDSFVVGNHVDGNAVVGFRGSVVYQEQADVGLGYIWVLLGGDQTESSSCVSGNLLARDIAGLEVVDLENLKRDISSCIFSRAYAQRTKPLPRSCL